MDALWNLDKLRRLTLMAWWPELIYWTSNGPTRRTALPGDGTFADGSVLLYMEGADGNRGSELQHEFKLVLLACSVTCPTVTVLEPTLPPSPPGWDASPGKTATKCCRAHADGFQEFPLLIGRIHAGPPILAEENFEEFIPLPSWLLPRAGELFLLRVIGDSMIGAGIADGDLVVVDQQAADNGDIVVALLDGEATVKTLSVVSGHVWLLPQRAELAPDRLQQA